MTIRITAGRRTRKGRGALPFFSEPGFQTRMARAYGASPSFYKPEEWLRWALAFAREDLDVLDAGARAERGEIIRMLTPALVRQNESWSGIPSYSFTARLPDALLRQLQKELRAGLDALLQGKTWILPAITGTSIWRYNPGQKEPQFRIGRGGDERINFLNGVAELLVAHGARLRACKQCRAPFLRRKRAEYCSPECGQTFRDQKKQRRKGGR